MQPENQNDLFGELTFDFTAKQYIRSIASWAMVIVVVALISYVISLVSVFSTPDIGPKKEGFDFGFKVTSESIGGQVFTVVVGLILNLFLFRFAMQARTGLNGLNQSSLNRSFINLKNYLMMASIIWILMLLLFILGVTVLSTAK
jgi:hypothetical protein